MNIKEILKQLASAEKKTIPILILSVIIGLAVVLSFPLLLIYGIKLLGFEGIQLSLKSYMGAILVLFFLSYASKMGSGSSNG